MEFHVSVSFIIEVIGTIVFVSSGVMAVIKQQLDLSGVVVPGITTAVGDGMIRDIILGNVPPSLFTNPVYVLIALVTVLALFIVVRLNQKMLENRYIVAYERMMNVFDAIDPVAFTVTGISAAVLAGYEGYHLLSMFLGMLTGVGNGVLRDIMVKQILCTLCKHVCASTSIAGALCYVFLSDWLAGDMFMIVGALVVILICLPATRYCWNLPTATEKRK